jgi:aminoglycoside/choline kinase family phosphotransferase
MTRAAEIGAFLELAGWGAARREPLAGDASARRYERLFGDGRAVLMDVPPGSGLVVAPFLAVAAWLRAGGFSAPEVLAADPAAGLVLLEDFGDDLFARICAAAPEREAGLYAAAVDLLADLQRRPPPNGGWTPPPYDMALLLREARLAVEWYLPAATGRPVAADLAAEFEALAEAAFAPVASARTAAVLRDYHAENLIWLPERPAHAHVGMLDFQDMLVGHPAYDLVSLLEDARRDTSPELRAAMLARYLERSGADPAAFGHAAHVLSAQRNLKILGLFTRLCRRDRKPRYLAHLPRVWGHLGRDLAAPGLAALAAFVARRLPPPEAAVLARIEAEA